MTFTYLLPEDRSAKASTWLFENKPSIGHRQFEDEIQAFQEVVGQIIDLLGAILPMIEPLDDGETLTYLHNCISWSDIRVRSPDEVQLFDSFLYDTDVLSWTHDGVDLLSHGRPPVDELGKPAAIRR